MIAEQGKLLAPNGKPSKLNRVQWAQVRTDNFKAWFGDWENDNTQKERRYDFGGIAGVSTETNSRTGGNAEQMGRADSRVRLDGFGRGRALLDATTREPKVFFHGTKDDIEAFDLNHPNRKDIGWLGRGIYVTDDARLANAYANLKSGNNGEFSSTNPDIRFNQKNNEQSLTPLNPVNTRNILDRLLRGFAPKTDAMRNSPVLRVRVVKSFVDLPLAIQEEANKQGSNGSDIKGVFHNNTFVCLSF
jgi:hypothetical protein